MDDVNPEFDSAPDSQAPSVPAAPAPDAYGAPQAEPVPPAQSEEQAASPAYAEPAMYSPPVQTGAAAPVPAAAPRSGVGAAIAVAIVVALFVGAMAGAAAGFAGAQLARGNALLRPAKVTVVPSKTSEPVVAAAAAAVPSVVNIDVSGSAESQSQNDRNLPRDHPNVPLRGNGSGVAYKAAPDGGTYIITNNHVVENATSIVVRDAAGARHDAKLVGRDPETDIAVVRVSGKVPGIQLGDSNGVQVGQLVVAIGSPFGLEHSVTSGVVSALGRSLPDFTGSSNGVYPLVNVIQTDAAINPGNSGGALVDRTGRLVGINTAIYSESGASGGVGFAIPVDTAQRVAEELIRGGKVQHPFLGVVGQTVDDQLAKEEKLNVSEGAFVVDLTPGTNAVKAGIKKGDVIVSLEETPIRSMDDLILQVRRRDVGDTVSVGLVRDGEKMTVDMTVGSKPANLDTSQPTTSTP